MLNIIETIPEGLLALPAEELYKVLQGPTLIHLQGRKNPPMFASVLLHGNEHTGWEAMRRILQEYPAGTLPRSLSLFIGNVTAARYNRRYLEGQPDYNRIWEGGDSPEHGMMQRVQDEMERRDVCFSIDIHNTTGTNPHYACVNKTYNEFMQLASLFSRTVVYFVRPEGVQSRAFAGICPAVTVECGKSGEQDGIDHAVRFVERCLQLDELPDHAVKSRDINLFHTTAIVKVSEACSFSFDHSDDDLQLYREIEHFNFREMPTGTVIGRVRDGTGKPLDVRDEHDNEVSRRYFTFEDGEVRSRQTVIPAMITLDTGIIRQDCLCYLMENYSL